MQKKFIIVVGAVLILVLTGLFLLIKPGGKTKQEAIPTQTPKEIGSEESPLSEEALIILGQNDFAPKTLTIKTEQKVIWKNESGEAATVNSSAHPTHRDYPPLNLGNFSDGQTLELIFDTPGTYHYHNHLNPSQTGTIIVQP